MRISVPACVASLALASFAPAADALEARQVRHADATYRVVDVDLVHDRLELRWKDPAGKPFSSIESLRAFGQAEGRSLLFATNAGIYDREFRPLGLHVEDGNALRPLNSARGNASRGNFAIQPNGVFHVDRDGKAGVVPTSQWRALGIDARIATQSGPMLVVAGKINPNFDEASDSLKLRSGVCALTPQAVVFAVSEVPVSFHAFARLFRDGIGCRDALYLDGTLSRVWTRADGYAGASPIVAKPYAGMLAVFEQAAPVP